MAQRRDTDLAKAFGARLRAAREDAGVSQEALAEAADVHRTFVGTLERGEAGPTLTTIVRMAEALGLDPADLVRGLRTTPPKRGTPRAR